MRDPESQAVRVQSLLSLCEREFGARPARRRFGCAASMAAPLAPYSAVRLCLTGASNNQISARISGSTGSGSDRIKAHRAWMIHLATARGIDTTRRGSPTAHSKSWRESTDESWGYCHSSAARTEESLAGISPRSEERRVGKECRS